MRSRRRPRRSRRDRRGFLVGAALSAAALSALAGLGYVYATARPPTVLDKATLCPLSGPTSVTAVLVDTSDGLPEASRIEVRTLLDDLAARIPAGGLLDVRALDSDVPGGVTILARCNPGDGGDIDPVTGNRERAKARWSEGFRKPLDIALSESLAGTPSRTSPIMGTIQRIALERFDGRANASLRKSLVVVSDMVEHGPDYSQYAGDMGYARFAASPAYPKVRTDLHGAEVTLLYVKRMRDKGSGASVRFWQEWVRDNGGRLIEARKLQGAG